MAVTRIRRGWCLHGLAIVCGVIVLGALDSRTAHGQVFVTWTGSGTNWSDSGNWSGTYGYGQLQWTGGGSSTSWDNRGNPESQWRFYFSGGSAYTLGGNAVSFFDFGGNRGGILSDSSATQTINMNLNFADNGSRDMFILARGSGGLTFGGTINLTNSMTSLGIGGSNSSSIITFNGPITGAKPVVVGTNAFDGGTAGMGATRAVFAGSNSYTGATTVTNGALTVAHANALGSTNSGTTVNSGASLRLSNDITVSGEALTLSGNGLDNNGALVSVSGSNAYTGLVTLGTGTTTIGATNSSTLVVSNVSGGGNELWVAGAGTTVIAGGATNSGSGTAFVKTNTGTAVLMASNAWSGNEFIREGTVVLSNNNALGTGGTTFLGATAGSAAASLSVGQGITNSNSITIEGGGTGTRTLSYAETSGTGTQLGSLTLNTNSLAFNVTNGGTLHFSGTVSTLGTARLSVDGGGTVISTGNSTGATSDNYQVRIGNGTLIIGGGTLIARTNVSGLGHAIDLGVDLGGNIVNASSRLYASNGVTVSNSIFVSTTNSQARVIGQQDMASPSTATYSGPIGLTNSSLTVEAGTNSIVTVSGVITNFGGTGNGLIKTGAGTAILTAANTFDGTTTISNGVLRITHASALGSSAAGTVVAGGGALEFSNNINVVGEAFTISGTGVGGNGALRNVSGANTNTGSLTLNADSRIQVETNTSLVHSGSVALGVNNLILGGSGTATISGAVTGSGGLTKADSVVVTLNNNANNLGLLTLNGGTLLATNNTRTTGLAGSAGAILNLQNPDDANKQFIVEGSGTNTFAGVVSGTSQFVKRGTGMQVFTGTNSNTSGIYIDGGSVSFQGAATAGSASLIDIGSRVFADRHGDSAELRLGGTDGGRNFTNAIAVWTNTGSATRVLASENTSGVNTWSGNITNAALNNGGFVVSNSTGGSLLMSGTVSGSGNLTKAGGGGLILSASNTYSGTTTLSNGILTVAHSYALGTGALIQSSAASTVQFSNAVTVSNGMSVYNVAFLGSSNTLSGEITNNNTTFDVASGETNTITGRLSGPGGLTKTGGGGLILAGANNNTYVGATVISNGALILSNSSGNAIHNSSPISVVGSGSSLVLGRSNMIGDGLNLILDGGTFITGNSTAGYAETLGNLTLSSSSTIDLGSLAGGGGTRDLVFANSSAITWSGTLVITNWQGLADTSGTAGRIFFGVGGLTSTQLAQIEFSGFGTGARLLGSGELTPIPEPRVYAAMLVLLAAIAWRERRRWWRRPGNDEACSR